MAKFKLGDRVIHNDCMSLRNAIIIEIDRKINGLYKLKYIGVNKTGYGSDHNLTLCPEFQKKAKFWVDCECGAHHTDNPNHHLDWCPRGDGKKYNPDPIKGYNTDSEGEALVAEFEKMLNAVSPSPNTDDDDDWTAF